MDFKDISPQIASVAQNYHYQNPPAALTLLSAQLTIFWRWLKDFLRSLSINIKFANQSNFESNLLQWLINAVLFICIFAIVTLIWLHLKKQQLQDSQTDRIKAQSEPDLDYALWHKQAQQFALAGNFKQAIRALYLSVLKLLDERNLATFAPTKTNREYLYALSTLPNIQLPFQQFTAVVEDVWFGYRSASAEDFVFCQQKLAEIEAELNQFSRIK